MPQAIHLTYDAEGHVIESDDNAVANGGFESGLGVGWSVSGGASWDGTTANSGHDSARLTGAADVTTTFAVPPGQTVRIQFATAASAGSAHVAVSYADTGGTFHPITGATWAVAATGWTTTAADVTIPQTGNGTVRVDLSTGSGETANVDDVAAFTQFTASTYNVNGTPATHLDILARTTRIDYAAGATYPAVFPTRVTAHYVDGLYDPAHPDTDVASTTTYDAWGRSLMATDPDGVTTTTAYAANLTDVAAVTDGAGDATTYPAYDADGRRLTVADPLGRQTTTTYDAFGNPLDVTAPDATVRHAVYDASGRLTASYANWTNGGVGTGGVANVASTKAYDAFGNVTRAVADAGVAAATTDTTYDLAGNDVTTTVYPAGTSGGRTTTTFYDAAGTAVATQGPIAPTATSAPLCPGSTTVRCTSVSTVDQNGRVTRTLDAYGTVTTTWSDLAGHTIRQVANDVASLTDPTTQDLTTTSAYDTAGRIAAVTDPLGRTTSTTYDGLDRITKATRPDGSWVRTDYTAAGRTDAVSRPGSSTQGDADVAWTKDVYDAAGRLVTTLDAYDRSGAAQLQTDGFESGSTAGWNTTGTLIWPGGSFVVSACPSCGMHTGLWFADIGSNGSYGAGAQKSLTGVFKAGHTYNARVWVRSITTGSPSILFLLGVDTGGGGRYGGGSFTISTAWQQLDISWTNTTGADQASVRVALRNEAGAGEWVIDDLAVWDAATPATNIPTTTVYDAAGEVTASIAPPGHAGDSAPVTASTYDPMGRLASVTVNAITGAGTGTTDTNLQTSYGYDALGDRTSVTDPGAVVTRYDYDRLGDATATTDNWTGGSATATHDVTSLFAYDNLGELTATCTAQAVQAHGCDPVGATSYAWTYAYDALGHQVRGVPPTNTSGLATAVGEYDVASGGGRLARTCQVSSGTACSGASVLRYTDLAYDPLARLSSTTTSTGDPGGTHATKFRYVTGYDAGGERTSLDEYDNGSSTRADGFTFGFDALARQTSVIRQGTTVTTTTYNPDDTVASRVDAAISATASTFTYDTRGELTGAASPVFTGTATFGWRLDGLVDGRTWPTNGATGAFGYDGAKRPTALAVTVGGSTTLASFGRTFNRTGTVTSETQSLPGLAGLAASATQTFTSDALHRVTASTLGSETRSYTYDADSNRLTQTKDGTTSTFAYDATDQLSSLTLSGVASAFAYDPYGNLTTAVESAAVLPDVTAPTTPAGLTATAQGKTRINLAWTASTDDTAVTAYRIYRSGALVMTVAGNVTAWSDFSLISGTAYSYTVDAVDGAGNASTPSSPASATTANGGGGSDTQAPSVPTGVTATGVTASRIDVTWTASTDNTGVQGYRVYRDGVLVATVGTARYDDTGLAVSTSHSYTVIAIDGAGNASAASSAGAGSTQGPPVRTTTYAYDTLDRLTSETPSGGTASTFTLDALGRHATRTTGATTETYTYAGTDSAVVRISTGTGATNAALDPSGTRLAVSAGSAFGWTLPDLHGDLAGYANAGLSGATDAFRYDPYGELLASVTSAVPSPWRYQGRLAENTGAGTSDLYDFGFRSYQPGLGAFTAMDTVAGGALDPLSLNRYLYAEANPTTLVDPDGHTAIALDDAAGTVLTHDRTHNWTTRQTVHRYGAAEMRVLSAAAASRHAQALGSRRIAAHTGYAGEQRQDAASVAVATAATDARESRSLAANAARGIGMTGGLRLGIQAAVAGDCRINQSCFRWSDVPMIGGWLQQQADEGNAWAAAQPRMHYNMILALPGGGASLVEDAAAEGAAIRVTAAAEAAGGGTGPGAWETANESMSTRAANYQAQVSGQSGQVYRVNGVKFDGFANGILQDAKGPGYSSFIKNGEFRDWFSGARSLRNQASLQTAAATGIPIQWSVAEPDAADTIRALLDGFSNINVVYVPPAP